MSALGGANRRSLETVFAQLFETVVAVPGHPPLADEASRLAAVVVPTIESFEAHFHIRTSVVTVVYRLTIFSPQGKTIAAWIVTGSGRLAFGPGKVDQEESYWFAEAEAMQQARRKILFGFREIPGVQEWLNEVTPTRLGGESEPPEQPSDTTTIAVDPYGDIARRKAVFGQYFPSEHVIAVRLVVRNDGESPSFVPLSGITLKLPRDQELSSVPPEAVPDPYESVILGSVNPVDPIDLAFLAIMLVARGSHAGAAPRVRQSCREKELPEITLPAGAEAQGFVYFIPGKGSSAFDEAVLNVRVVDLSALRTSVLSLPVTGLNFRGRPK